MHWIEPYSGRILKIQGTVQETIQAFLKSDGVQRGQQVLSLETLMEIRWEYDIRRLLPTTARLRIFRPDGLLWLNPFLGTLDSTVALVENRITGKTIRSMARSLALCRDADAGTMLSQQVLEERLRLNGCEVKQIVTVTKPIHRTVQETEANKKGAPETGVAATAPAAQPDLSRAAQMQKRMLAEIPKIDGYRFAVRYEPHQQVGGDIYEFRQLDPTRLLVIFGDVSGHGVEAAIGATAILKTIRQVAREGVEDVVEYVCALNGEVKADLMPGQFVTLIAGILDIPAKRMEFVLAGHHPMTIVSADASVPIRLIGIPGMALGLVQDDRFRASLQTVEVDFGEGDRLLMHSDGVEEGRDTAGNPFGRSRIQGIFLAQSQTPLATALWAILRAHSAHVAGAEVDGDDFTLVGLEVLADTVSKEGVPSSDPVAGMETPERSEVVHN
jgi:serine phosphatase RsbU (regulator of sigma subunit)